MAHANDNATPEYFVEISSAILITLGLSSAIGALLAALVMGLIGANGLYAFTTTCLIIFFVIVLLRRNSQVLPDNLANKDSFYPVSDMATTVAYQMDPRTEDDIN